MSQLNLPTPPVSSPSRRALVTGIGKATLSATALAMVAGCAAMGTHSTAAVAADVKILNVALDLEHEAIGAYRLGAESGLLTKPVLDVAVAFLGDKSEQDSNLRFVHDMLTQRAEDPVAVLTTYRQIIQGQRVQDDRQSAPITHLKLAGIVGRQKILSMARQEIVAKLVGHHHHDEPGGLDLGPGRPVQKQ